MAEVVKQFEALRVATAHLRRSCSHMMWIYMLAHHTTGAGWNTVAQLRYRVVLGLQDGFKPVATWDEKVTAAMHICKQHKHLTNDGIPMGPICPRLPKRSFAVHTNSNASNAGRSRHSPRGGAAWGRFARGGSQAGRRAALGKEETARQGRAPAAAAPAAAPGGAAAAAAAGGAA